MLTSKTFTRRIGLKTLAAAVLATGMGTALAQDDYPSKPITMIVPFSAGGTTDILARIVGQYLGQKFGESVVIENRDGAGGNIGTQMAARAKADGYTLLMGAVHHTIATSVYKKLSYSFQKDLTAVSPVAMVPNILVVNAANTPAKTVAELVELAKKSSVELAYGSNGNGTAQHLIGTQFQNSGAKKWTESKVRPCSLAIAA